MNTDDILKFDLIKTRQRLTFDIHFQREDTIYRGEDEGDYFVFRASNGVEIYSRTKMDLHTDRLWLLGAAPNTRSGSFVYNSDKKRDIAYDRFMKAIHEWVQWVRDTGGHVATGHTKVLVRPSGPDGDLIVVPTPAELIPQD